MPLVDLKNRDRAAPTAQPTAQECKNSRAGPLAGLALIDTTLALGDLDDYCLAFSAHPDLWRRLALKDRCVVILVRAELRPAELPPDAGVHGSYSEPGAGTPT